MSTRLTMLTPEQEIRRVHLAAMGSRTWSFLGAHLVAEHGWQPEDLQGDEHTWKTRHIELHPPIPTPAPPAPLLNEFERDSIKVLGKWFEDYARWIVGAEDTRTGDLDEAAAHVHALQHAVMAQAAARAYPHEFRLLGRTIDTADSEGDTP